MLTDVRLVNHKDFSQDSKYAGQYMMNADFYDNTKPFIHLKLDQACRKTKPEGDYDYEFEFTADQVTLTLMLITSDAKAESMLYAWEQKVVESINSLAIKEFGATDAWPEDEKISVLLSTLAKRLDKTVVDVLGNNYSISASANF